ncbi:tetratricopeptide repeat protein [Paracraurococcus lichenis]|uniref:Tetratricopeptide repeat protein n=1 Tax=Paracraurococcus lichenis TaxID=3064888 RepID=A0ABT9E205_9PROT|nr:tetratricopeptide repeat protein [Paracraurococcus sp. LOR1-02]MDO9710179.1 tetratricopeptide repeat protein [Paracraurococcus sp. LOR1-02]
MRPPAHRPAIWPALALLAAVASCAPPEPGRSGFGPTVRVCDGGGCREQPTGMVTAELGDRRATPPTDPDAYKGEDPAALRAAAAGGDARAAYLLGQVEEFGLGGRPRRPAEAAAWYDRAAEAGNPWAQFRLANLLAEGRGARRDPARATALTAQAAGAGHPLAAYNLGMMALRGQGVPRDPNEAARWLTLAAEGGVVEAQYTLGTLYLRGDGVPLRLYEGLTWMRQAAQGGYPPAQKAVGRIYMTGLDTMGQDLQEARTWLGLAAGRGDREAQRWLQEIARAEREERDYRRALALQAEQTRAMLYAVTLAAILTPPVVYYLPY